VSGQKQLDDNDPLTYAVIGEAMRVHNELGPGLDEMFYHELLSGRLVRKGIAHRSKARAELLHRGQKADVFESDLLFEKQLVAELKTLQASETFAPEHIAQLISYLKFWRIGTGLLLDFGKERLIYKRVVFTVREPLVSDAVAVIEQASALAPWKEAARPVFAAVVRVFQTHGLGYCDTTYRGLIAAELVAENKFFINEPDAIIQRDCKVLGRAICHCILTGKIALLVLALRDKISTTDRAILQTYLKLLGLAGGVIVNYGKRSLDVQCVNPPGYKKANAPNQNNPDSSSAVVSESAGNPNLDMPQLKSQDRHS
jgi:GxxExxY protein